jgi:putative transcriptional regulator
MIRCHLGRLLGERKLKIAELARSTGIHRNTLTQLYMERATRVDLETIDILCGTLGVPVAELLEFVPPATNKTKRDALSPI